MKDLKLVSWNVNGIRAAAKKGLIEWIEKEKPDIFCVQETKAWEEQLDDSLTKIDGYHVYFAEAYKKAELLRGEGDAEAARIYAEGFSQDPEFYEFTRSIKAYVETFEDKGDVMLIDANSDFLKYLNTKEISK